MGQKLVIVESPAKARAIQKYLGTDFRVVASMGHVRDLPKSGLAIDLEHDFAPEYEVTNKKVVNDLRQAVKQADAIYLATDPDREGEAIAWHITEATGVSTRTRKKASTPVYRVVFHEITKNAVQAAISTPRDIDENLVDAQQARRVLDRLVGYQLSPLLWDKVRRGLSAGRVQSVAVRMIVERERDIEAFVAVEYWTIEADLQKQQASDQRSGDSFRAFLIEQDGKKLDKFAIGNQEQAEAIVANLEHARYSVHKVTRKDKRRNPAPPFTTSTLQQEAGRKLGFSAKKTMTLAQRLYEGIDVGGSDGTTGLITYMRTDSVNVAGEAQQEARQVITERYGTDYVPNQPPTYKTRSRGAQEAHEAIRPTSSARTPDSLSALLERDMLRLYDLIWKRFLASQMSPAIFDSTSVDIAAHQEGATTNGTPAYMFRATGSVLKFPGFLAIYNEGLDEGEEDEDKEKRLPLLNANEPLNLLALLPIQHFTEPSPRYTEASLVKELERLGIGRPSTYAPIISTIQDRQYVELREKKLFPTALGRVVTDLLVEHFGGIVDYDFTSGLEQQLDDVATGEKKWVPLMRDFYGPFAQTLEQARHTMRNIKQQEIPTGITCPKCQQGSLVVRFGRNGEFLSCSRYNKKGGPDSCDFTSNFHYAEDGTIVLDEPEKPEFTDVMCTVCGKPMVKKRGRFGEFLGCSGYPECTNIRRLDKNGQPVPLPEPTGVSCPKCHEGEMLKRRGRFGRPFYGCSRYPQCDYATNDLALVDQYDPEQEQQGEETASNKPAATAKKTTAKKTSTKVTRSSSSKTSSSKTTSKTSNSTAAKAASDNETGETTNKPASKPASSRKKTTSKKTSR
jgi:DNA topoisomerase-1